ncbi:MAG: tyrosine-type recombinase/integrase [Blautia marasmi]
MSSEDYKKLDSYLFNNMDPFSFGILLCMYTGIRVGELSGLKWEDIDFAQCKIQIRRTVTRVKPEYAYNRRKVNAPAHI